MTIVYFLYKVVSWDGLESFFEFLDWEASVDALFNLQQMFAWTTFETVLAFHDDVLRNLEFRSKMDPVTGPRIDWLIQLPSKLIHHMNI